MDFMTENMQKKPENSLKGMINNHTLLQENAGNIQKGAYNSSTLCAKNVQVWAFGDTLVRTIQLENQPWFIGKDVATALEYKLTTDLTKYLDPDEVANCVVPTSGGAQEVLVINEPGLYHAIFMSRKEAAKEFRRGGTGEVLPSLRKTGAYALSLVAEQKKKKKRNEVARLKANRYVLEHIEELHKDGAITPEFINRLAHPAKKHEGHASSHPILVQRMKEWICNLVYEPGSFERLSDLHYAFCLFIEKEITQSMFTRLLKSQLSEVVISQRKLDGGNVPVQVVLNFKLKE